MVYFFTNTVNSRTLWEVDDENRRKNPVFDIRDTLEKYACIYRNTTLKLFQYCQETDIYERLDEYLRPVKILRILRPVDRNTAMFIKTTGST